MSAKEDVFGEHELRVKLYNLLAEHEKDLRHLAQKFGHGLMYPATWQERQAVEVLRSDYVDDMIKEIRDVR